MKMKINLSDFVATASLKDDRLRSLIKCLYVIAIKKESRLNSSLLKILRDNSVPAVDFLREHRLGSKQWKKLFEQAALKDFEQLEKPLEDVWLVMREKSAAYSSNSVMSNLYAGIIRDFRSYLKSDSDNAYLRLEKNAKETNEKAIYSKFLPEEQDASEQINVLRQLISKYEPGNKTLTLSIHIAERLRRDDEPTYKQYLKMRLDMRKAWAAEVMAYVRTSGRKLVDVNDLKKHMANIGMPNLLQDGFVGQIDENGNYYTVRGKTSQGRQLKTTPGGYCTMNPAYNVDSDNTYVLKSKTPGAKNETTFYTIDFGASSQNDKYSKVIDNIPHFEQSRSKWIKDILHGMGEKFLYAMLCEVCYLSTARIGSRDVNISQKGDFAGKPTYGIRTLLCKHAKVEENRIYISYLGVKTSARLRHYIYKDTPQGKKIYNYIKQRVAKAEPNDPLFVHMGQMANPTKLNAYVKSLGLSITIHKFRTIQGTEYFNEFVKKSTILKKKNPDKKDVVKEIDSILEKVGSALGHYSSGPDGKKVTGTTALQYYVVPKYPLDLLDRFKIRYPSKYQKVYDDVARGKLNDD